MKRLPASLLFLATLSAPTVLAQHQHFENFEWRERLTDHFALRAKGTNHDPARRYAEKVWDECVHVMPGLEEDFSKNKFRTPGGASGAATAPYRFTVYLIGSGLDYTTVLEQQQRRSGWGANQVQSCRITRNYGDPQNRYRVLCKADPEKSAGGETDLTPVFVHGTAATILEGRGLTGNLPFWMTAGWGYYVEHRIFRLCRVHYIDFKTYYANEKADFKRGATLEPNEDWPGPLKKMCKKDIRETLDTRLQGANPDPHPQPVRLHLCPGLFPRRQRREHREVPQARRACPPGRDNHKIRSSGHLRLRRRRRAGGGLVRVHGEPAFQITVRRVHFSHCPGSRLGPGLPPGTGAPGAGLKGMDLPRK